MVEPSVVNKPQTFTPTPVLAPEPPASPVAVDPSPSLQPAEEPPVLFEPTDSTPEPLAAPPTTDDDLFGTPAEEPAPMEDDNLFGDEALETDAADDGLFGEPAAPMEDDDLFGDPADEPGGEPAAEKDGDLFGMPTEDEPIETPAADADDMFGEPELDSVEKDLFGTPESEDAGGLFGDPAEEVPAEEVPAEEEEDDLFGGFGMILQEPGGIDSGEMRTWVDNTGSFSCQGRIAQVMDGQVQLLKKNGRTSTVPFYRLSRTDLEFVHRQASAQKSDSVAKTAAL